MLSFSRQQQQQQQQKQQPPTVSSSSYQAIVLFLIMLQVTTMMWTTNSVNHQLDQIQVASSEGFDNINSNGNGKKTKQDFMMRSKQQQQQQRIAKSMPSSSTSSVQVPAQCMALMQKFHDINERYRNGDDESVSKPLINYAYYKSQGFGRLVDHSTAHCILAMALDRPCALDLTDRDPYYTWRHFINVGSYDWEMTGPNQELLPDVSQAISELHDIGDNAWKNGINGDYTKIHLMQTPPADWPAKPKRTNPQDFERHLQAWRGDNKFPGEDNNKAMLSPNWGSVWFPQLTLPDEIQGCNRIQLLALMQNALYQPTALSLKLHHERLVQALATQPLSVPDEAESKKNIKTKKAAAAAKKMQPIVNQQQRLLEKTEPYGAIHVRTVILKTSTNGEERLANLESTLVQCLHHVRLELLAKNKRNVDITKWWILSDKPPVAVDLAQNITDFALFHAYHLDDGFHDNNAHSALPSARGVFAHTNMAPSIADWLVLHESDVALVTHGSFGDTGARGKGKYPRTDMAKECDFFQVFY